MSPDFDSFETRFNAGEGQIVYRRVVNDVDTPVSAYLKIAAGKPYAFLYESVSGGEQRGRYSFIGFAPDLVWRAHGDACEIASRDQIARRDFRPQPGKPLDNLRALQEDSALPLPDGLPPMAAGLFGYLGYDMVRQVEDLPSDLPDPIGTPDAIMIRPTIMAIFDLIAQEVIIATPVRPAGGTAQKAYNDAQARIEKVAADMTLSASMPPARNIAPQIIEPLCGQTAKQFHARVAKAKDYIHAGDVFQVVIGQRLSAPLTASPLALYRSLRRMNPSPFLYFLNFDDHAIVGSSPEILVRLRDDVVTIRPIAGTRPRGKTPEADIALEAELLADEKECAEHLMLLDLGRNDVGRVSKPGTVKVTERFNVERYSHVIHIVSNVEGKAKDDVDAMSALFAGFPAGTVSGAPKVRAMEIIDELETEKRGIYAGAVGYISPEGDLDTAIVLRTAIIKDGVMHVRAGAGIVRDSDPQSEYEETKHKAAALFAAAAHAAQFDGN